MRFALVILAALMLVGESEARDRRCRHSRTSRNLDCVGYAFFEFAPASGAGMPAACSTTAPTGAKGEAMTFARASNGTCTKGTDGLRTTAIADGDLVVLSSNVARVEANSLGELWLLVESAHTNTCLRSAEICNAAWADVGTPNCASDARPGPFGTTTMDQLNDNTDLSQEGRSQAITTTSATRHTVSCYVKAGTATEATITLRGTGNAAGDCTGTATALSTSTSKRITCTSAAAYTAALTSVTVSILVGDVAEDTGSIYVEGCDHVVSSTYLLSHVPTTSAAATQLNDVAYFTPASTLPLSPLSIAGSREGPATSAAQPNTTIVAIPATSLTESTNLSLLYGNNSGLRCWNNNNFDQRVAFAPSGISRGWCAIDRANATATDRVRGEWPVGSAMVDGTNSNTGASSNAFAIRIGDYGSASGPTDGLVGRICVDPEPTRCR